MKHKKSLLLIVVFCILVGLAGCTSTLKDDNTKLDSEIQDDILNKERPDEPLDNDLIINVENKESIKAELINAIIEIVQPARMEVSGVGFSENPEIDIKNLYYEILSELPELKYAYDISAILDDSVLTCQISYMPYKTGDYPDGFAGIEVSRLIELIDTAQSNLGIAPIKIHITNQSLDPDLINFALQQAGNGYIICSLNNDATEIIYHAPVGFIMQDCLSAIDEANQIADEIISKLINETMSKKEKAEVLFSYVSENVKYDGRYNTDRANMPYDSQTALGALKYGTAICGGYSHAVKLLFEKVGIPCLNVTGMWFGTNHMWNIAYIDGEWLWCDATADRGNSIKYGLNHFALNELDPLQYQWNSEQTEKLLYQ